MAGGDLLNKQTILPVQQQGMSSCRTRRHVFLLNKNMGLLIPQECVPCSAGKPRMAPNYTTGTSLLTMKGSPERQLKCGTIWIHMDKYGSIWTNTGNINRCTFNIIQYNSMEIQCDETRFNITDYKYI